MRYRPPSKGPARIGLETSSGLYLRCVTQICVKNVLTCIFTDDSQFNKPLPYPHCKVNLNKEVTPYVGALRRTRTDLTAGAYKRLLLINEILQFVLNWINLAVTDAYLTKQHVIHHKQRAFR